MRGRRFAQETPRKKYIEKADDVLGTLPAAETKFQAVPDLAAVLDFVPSPTGAA
jgi:hypothetical protein